MAQSVYPSRSTVYQKLGGIGENLDDGRNECGGEVGAGSAPQNYLETAIYNLVGGLFHKAGNVHEATLAQTKAAIITFVGIETESITGQ